MLDLHFVILVLLNKPFHVGIDLSYLLDDMLDVNICVCLQAISFLVFLHQLLI